MKRHLIFLALMSIFSVGCSSNDPISQYLPIDIKFILQDGSPIIEGDCINPFANYAVRIRVSEEGNSNFENTVVQYSVNGNLSSVTFTDALSKTINVSVVEGNNIAQLVESGFSNSIYLIAESEFEVVP